MIGKYNVIIENAYLKYEFEIRRNITIIKGQSATGKTTLVEMIRSYNEQEDTGITVKCDKTLRTVYGKDWQEQLKKISDSIVFIDEQSRFVKSKEFAQAIKGSDNYYVIVTREKLCELPYSVTEIYGIRTSGKYAGLISEYTRNEFYRIYANEPVFEFEPDVVITEDSNSGYEFWKSVKDEECCIAAEGKGNILKLLKCIEESDNKYLAIVDGAAFGSEMDEIISYIKFSQKDIKLYAPESFEFLILSSRLFDSKEIKNKCINTEQYADSTKYMSWEQFYTDVLTKETQNTVMQYNKKGLNAYYLSEKNMKIILEQVPEQIKIGDIDGSE